MRFPAPNGHGYPPVAIGTAAPPSSRLPFHGSGARYGTGSAPLSLGRGVGGEGLVMDGTPAGAGEGGGCFAGADTRCGQFAGAVPLAPLAAAAAAVAAAASASL